MKFEEIKSESQFNDEKANWMFVGFAYGAVTVLMSCAIMFFVVSILNN